MNASRTACLIACLAALFLTCGCQSADHGRASSLNPKILTEVKPGMPQSRLESFLGVPARHEFTIGTSDATNRCVSYYFAAYYLKYYFVFTNDALEKIILPPRFEHELSPWEQGKRAVWTSYDPEERVSAVLGASALQRDDILESIEHRYKPAKFDNALPAAIIAGIISAPVELTQSSRRSAERREIDSLAQRFYPYYVRLGLTIQDVEQRYGAAHFAEKHSDSEIRYYGSSKLGLEDQWLWVSVVFKNGGASEVFSDDFFDYHKIQEEH